MVKRVDLTDDSGILRDSLRRISGAALTTVPHGVKDLGERGDVVWSGAGGASSVRAQDLRITETAEQAAELAEQLASVDAELDAAGERLTSAEAGLVAADERITAEAHAAGLAIQAAAEQIETVGAGVVTAQARADKAVTDAADARASAVQAISDAGSAAAAASAAQARADKAVTDAAAAASAASGARQVADQAGADLVTLAGRTGRLIRSASAPTGADRNVNNLWLNTSTGRLSQWTGTVWQVITDDRLTAATTAADQAANLAGTAQSAADDAAMQASAASTLAGAAKTAAEGAQATATGAQSAASAAAASASSVAAAAAAAQGTADQAKADAAAAAGVAGGKADVLIQAATPVAAMRKPTTLWIDTTGGANTPKRWSGSAWAEVTDKAAKDAAAAAAAAQARADKGVADAAAAKQAANEAAAAALGAQATADSAAAKASTADGRYTVATANPTGADAAGKPTGAVWEVRSGGVALRRFVLTAATTWTQVKAGQDFIGDKAIGRAQIGDLAVGTAQLADAAITNAKVGDLAVDKLTASVSRMGVAAIDQLIGDAAFFGALSTRRLAVGSASNMLSGVEGWGVAGAAGPETPWRNFGHNTADPSMWVKGTQTLMVEQELTFTAGTRYRFEVDVKASVDGTHFFWRIFAGTTAITFADLTNGPGTTSSAGYPFSSQLVTGTGWNSFWMEGTAQVSGIAKLYIFANHANGSPNPDGFQWFRAPRIRPMTGAVLIENGAVTAEKILATAELWAKVLAVAGDATIGGRLVVPNSITAGHMTIAPGNMWPDPYLAQHATDWATGTGITYTVQPWAQGRTLGITAAGVPRGAYFRPAQLDALTLEPGAVYRVSARIRFGGTANIKSVSIYARYRNTAGETVRSRVGVITRTAATSYVDGVDGVLITAPADLAGACTLGWFVGADAPDGTVSIGEITVTRAADASLIVDGAVKARHVEVTEQLTAAIAAIMQLDVSKLTVTGTSVIDTALVKRLAAEIAVAGTFRTPEDPSGTWAGFDAQGFSQWQLRPEGGYRLLTRLGQAEPGAPEILSIGAFHVDETGRMIAPSAEVGALTINSVPVDDALHRDRLVARGVLTTGTNARTSLTRAMEIAWTPRANRHYRLASNAVSLVTEGGGRTNLRLRVARQGSEVWRNVALATIERAAASWSVAPGLSALINPADHPGSGQLRVQLIHESETPARITVDTANGDAPELLVWEVPAIPSAAIEFREPGQGGGPPPPPPPPVVEVPIDYYAAAAGHQTYWTTGGADAAPGPIAGTWDGAASHDRYGLWFFPSADGALGTSPIITEILLTIRNTSFYNSSGGSVAIYGHGHLSGPPSPQKVLLGTIGNILPGQTVTWRIPPQYYTAFIPGAAGQLRGIGVGSNGNTSTTWYSRWAPEAHLRIVGVKR